MRTRSQARRRRQPQVRQTSVESSNLEKPDNPPIVTMADNRTMAQLLESTHRGLRGGFPHHGVFRIASTRYFLTMPLTQMIKYSVNSVLVLETSLTKLPRESSASGSGTLPGNTVTNPKEDLKGITTRSGVTIQGPKAVNHDTEVTKDTMPPANNGSTEDVQPPVVPIQSSNPNLGPNVAPVIPPVPKASIPFPSRRNDERRKEKANDQIEKFYEFLRD
ncbi:hypothetical protein Tco_1575589 [Tanacetum coccineum]